jgi:hypothetical protein
MNLDPTWLLLSPVPGSVGVVLFRYGKQERLPQLAVGFLMTDPPYLVSSVLAPIAAGLLPRGCLWYALRMRW